MPGSTRPEPCFTFISITPGGGGSSPIFYRKVTVGLTRLFTRHSREIRAVVVVVPIATSPTIIFSTGGVAHTSREIKAGVHNITFGTSCGGSWQCIQFVQVLVFGILADQGQNVAVSCKISCHCFQGLYTTNSSHAEHGIFYATLLTSLLQVIFNQDRRCELGMICVQLNFNLSFLLSLKLNQKVG